MNMNYLSFLPLAIVGLAVCSFAAVLLRDILRGQPGPTTSIEAIELNRFAVRVERFNRRLTGYRVGLRSKLGAGHE